MKITIIGPGVVGSATGVYLAKLGHRITYVGTNEKKMAALKKKGLDATTDLRLAILNTDVAFICVPTPAKKSGEIDLSYIKKVTKEIATALKEKNQHFLIVMKSTVVPGTCEEVVAPILNKYYGGDYGLCMNPEFLTASHEWDKSREFVRDMDNQERIVIGSKDKFSADTLESIYALSGVPIVHVSLKEAELIKYTSNCILATKVSYWNEIALLCEKLKLDAQKIADIVARDTRIGRYGSVLTGWKNGKLNNKAGFFGTCLPKDSRALYYFGTKKKVKMPILKATIDINDYVQKRKL